MKVVLSSKGSSTDKCSSSSTVSGESNGHKTNDEVLKQLKDKLGGVSLFEALEKDFIYGYNIKTLLKKLDIPDAPSEVVDFL